MTRLLLAIVALYRNWLSPALHSVFPGGCGYSPTCSEYAEEAIRMHGPWRGGLLAVWRILRCNPLNRAGFDPVPLPGVGHPELDGCGTTHHHDPLP
jgi:putative membrane protein insertion efficiency factor